MRRKDFLLALLVVFIWGTTFTVIKLGISGMPSLVLVAGRYFFTFFPAIFFVKKPNVPWRYVLIYGFVAGVLQFASLFYALEIGMPAGVSSVALQSSAFFTAIFAFVFLKEPMNRNKVIGLTIAGIGLLIIGLSKAQGTSYIPPIAMLFVIFSAVTWGLANIIIKYAGSKTTNPSEKFDSFSFLIWSSLIPPVPLLILSFMIYPADAIFGSISSLNIISLISILYLAFFGTLLGYGLWNHLLAKYPASKVAPFSLLVPVTGFLLAFVVLRESITLYQFAGILIIIIGLALANYTKQKS